MSTRLIQVNVAGGQIGTWTPTGKIFINTERIYYIENSHSGEPGHARIRMLDGSLLFVEELPAVLQTGANG